MNGPASIVLETDLISLTEVYWDDANEKTEGNYERESGRRSYKEISMCNLV